MSKTKVTAIALQYDPPLIVIEFEPTRNPSEIFHCKIHLRLPHSGGTVLTPLMLLRQIKQKLGVTEVCLALDNKIMTLCEKLVIQHKNLLDDSSLKNKNELHAQEQISGRNKSVKPQQIRHYSHVMGNTNDRYVVQTETEDKEESNSLDSSLFSPLEDGSADVSTTGYKSNKTLLFGDFNTASKGDLVKAKEAMNVIFTKHQIKPTDNLYIYDKRVEFEPADEESSWD